MAKKTEPKTKPVAPAKKVAKPAAKKKPAAPKAKPAATAKAPKPAPAPKFTQDDIALRAYFIAEKRRAHGLPGDEHQDWIEAERQLLEETAPKKKARKA